jgi:hypothetical protein
LALLQDRIDLRRQVAKETVGRQHEVKEAKAEAASAVSCRLELEVQVTRLQNTCMDITKRQREAAITANVQRQDMETMAKKLSTELEVSKNLFHREEAKTADLRFDLTTEQVASEEHVNRCKNVVKSFVGHIIDEIKKEKLASDGHLAHIAALQEHLEKWEYELETMRQEHGDSTSPGGPSPLIKKKPCSPKLDPEERQQGLVELNHNLMKKMGTPTKKAPVSQAPDSSPAEAPITEEQYWGIATKCLTHHLVKLPEEHAGKGEREWPRGLKPKLEHMTPSLTRVSEYKHVNPQEGGMWVINLPKALLPELGLTRRRPFEAFASEEEAAEFLFDWKKCAVPLLELRQLESIARRKAKQRQSE